MQFPGQAFRAYLRRFAPIAVLFLVAQTLVRLGLAIKTGTDFIGGPWDAVRPFAIGLWFDMAVLLALLIPGTLYWVLLPASWRGGRLDNAMTFASFLLVAFVTGFTMIGETLFWSEFGARFNFIAVDYLVYTREVVGNIWESYPVGKLLNGLIAVAVILAFLFRKQIAVKADGISFPRRAAVGLLVVAAALVSIDASKSSWTQLSANTYANELSGNGYYSLLRAYFHNEIDYRRFYLVADEQRVNDRIKSLVAADDARFVSKIPGDITRDIVRRDSLLRKNVVLVTMESLSANYMGQFGNRYGLTPNLDALANRSVFFTNMLATGTRTVRGLEAVTLSVPPTPGQSILRRPGHENLFSLGSVLRDHGYSSTYFYGGDGDFDNMNAFFKANDYKIVDRAKFESSEITFSNAWGVCDEDVFARAVKEADRSFASGKLFFQHVMTVSNHRPYTYPAGRISPPQIAGPAPLVDMSARTLAKYVEQTRDAAVKYTDYAIGKFLDQARSKPWFKDTLFVFVADHTASAAGKVEVDPGAYHIPAIFYAPDFIEPRRVDRLVSQMDIAPTILGALHMSYRSRFVGSDQFDGQGPERALISNYEKVALVRGKSVVLLGPKRDVRGYAAGRRIEPEQIDKDMIFDAVAFYQHASRWKDRFAGISSVVPGGPGD